MGIVVFVVWNILETKQQDTNTHKTEKEHTQNVANNPPLHNKTMCMGPILSNDLKTKNFYKPKL